jgi:hypothetical protein
VKTSPLLAGLGLLLFPIGLHAQEALTMTYPVFEEAIPHVDLAECPSSLAAEDRFCRATIGGDMIHVFAFGFDGDQPLLGYEAFSTEVLDTLG